MPALGLGVLGFVVCPLGPQGYLAGQNRNLEARGKPFELSLGVSSHDTCPCLIIPWQQSRLLADALADNGSHVEFRLLGQAGHGGPEFHEAEQGEAIRNFCRRHLLA